MAVTAFLLLRAMIGSWNAGVEGAAGDRMVVRNKISTAFPLSIAQVERIKSVPGVQDVSWLNWFAGVYKDERSFFAQYAVDAESFFRIYPELRLPPEEMRAWLDDRTGAVVGDLLAARHGWKVGDKIPLDGTVYPGAWTFTLRGIYTASGRTDRDHFYFHWKYLNEKVPEDRKDQVGRALAKVSGESVGVAIDTMFADSLGETRTESETAYQRATLAHATSVLAAFQVVSAVVLIILILILGNTLVMSTRERNSEYGAMRVLGFRPRHIAALVLGEGAIVATLGAVAGVAATPGILHLFGELLERRLGTFLSSFELSPKAAAAALVVTLACGLLTAALPAWRVVRMPIVQALRKID
jgi:putative ABC transport system permease protein